jgi:hypothetical protein
MLWEGRSETANSQSMLWERRSVGNCELPVDVMGKAGKAVGNYELPVDVNEKAVIFASFLSVISRVPVLGFIKRVFSLLFLRVLFSDLSNKFSLFYLSSFILYGISRVLVSDLASLLSSMMARRIRGSS